MKAVITRAYREPWKSENSKFKNACSAAIMHQRDGERIEQPILCLRIPPSAHLYFVPDYCSAGTT
jgi:hypothetical protein